MEIQALIDAIAEKHAASGITLHPPASEADIQAFEAQIGFALPLEFRQLYLICNGLECNEDIFRIIPLEEILQFEEHYGADWFFFAEYMIYSDAWLCQVGSAGNPGIYTYNKETYLSKQLADFLDAYLKGDVFEEEGLYDWAAKCKDRPYLN